MIRWIRQFGEWLRGKLGGWAQSLWQTIRREPLSARVVALLGLMLALVSAIEEGFIDRFAKPPAWWEDIEGYVALGLTVALLLASAWFSADVRRVKKWSQVAGELRDRVMDVESLHPRTLAESLVSKPESTEGGEEQKDLQTFVSEVNKVFVEDRRIPELKDIQDLERLAKKVLDETREMSEADLVHSPEAAAAWESVARLRAATSQARIELEAAGNRRPGTGQNVVNVNRDPRNRWTDLLAMATVLIGLIAAPAVADELTGDDRAGLDAPAVSADDDTTDDDPTDNDTTDNDTEQATPTTTSPLVGELQAQLLNLQSVVAALDGRLSATTTPPAGLDQGLAGIATQLQQRDDLQVAITIRAGDSLWELAEDVCENNGSAREIAADVISIWNANASTIGANPDELPSENEVLVNCAD